LAPPTRRLFTSSTGVTVFTACSSTSTGGFPVRSPMRSSTSYTIFSAVDFLPRLITLLITWVTSGEL
jgi:hypothetical protein